MFSSSLYKAALEVVENLDNFYFSMGEFLRNADKVGEKTSEALADLKVLTKMHEPSSSKLCASVAKMKAEMDEIMGDPNERGADGERVINAICSEVEDFFLNPVIDGELDTSPHRFFKVFNGEDCGMGLHRAIDELWSMVSDNDPALCDAYSQMDQYADEAHLFGNKIMEVVNQFKNRKIETLSDKIKKGGGNKADQGMINELRDKRNWLLLTAGANRTWNREKFLSEMCDAIAADINDRQKLAPGMDTGPV